MRKIIRKIAITAILASSALMYSCKDKEEKADSYGPNENYQNETPSTNDNATRDTANERGPGSATIGDTVNKTPPEGL
jgi:hypothetical protein